MDETIKNDEEMEQESYATVMPLIPLRGMSVFPGIVLHFDVGREKSILALERAMMLDQTVFLTAQMKAETDLPTAEDFYHFGTVARIKQMLKLPGDNIRVLVEGEYRAQIDRIVQEVPYFLCSASKIEDDYSSIRPVDSAALMRMAISLFSEYVNKHPQLSAEVLAGISSIEDGGRLADIITSNIQLKVEDSQRVLEARDVEKRLRIVVELLTRENEILQLEDKISHKVRTQIDKSQREYYLREQIRAIQEELGGGESDEDEIEGWRKKLESLKLDSAIDGKIKKEIDRISNMAPNSPEATVSRTYIEWILALPWNESSDSKIDLKGAQKILDEDHYGLEKVKDRIIEYLAVKSLAENEKGPILCLVGPPGVGKTSIGKSIARSVGRKFVRMSLGGVRDEAEIRGHRRTYIGAIPGRVMTQIKECGARDPVFLFDEVDKIGKDYRGDPSSALLEVLDPEQNKEFVDHYLEVPFDLSKVMFITTANTTDSIPAPLLDRMEVIRLSGYTDLEKFNIAKKYLVPKQIKANGLTKANISITASAIRGLISNYTREAGVRNLEKEIANLCRKVARKVVEGEPGRHSITASKLEDYLGKKRFRFDKLLGKNEIGVATGLAWTAVGGETLFIETAVMPGSGQVSLTGQLGDVMQESAKTAISVVRARVDHLGIEEEFYKTKDIHIHIPEGAIPKDGPSAGATICTSLVSALSGRPVRKDVAMTGEITLRGSILPVGGIKEKVLAAHRMGVSKVLIPYENARDIEELPEEVRDSMDFVLMKEIDDALKEAVL